MAFYMNTLILIRTILPFTKTASVPPKLNFNLILKLKCDNLGFLLVISTITFKPVGIKNTVFNVLLYRPLLADCSNSFFYL